MVPAWTSRPSPLWWLLIAALLVGLVGGALQLAGAGPQTFTWRLPTWFPEPIVPSDEIVFHNTGLYNIGGGGNYPPDNRGVYDVTGKPEHMGAFRTPTLRNIALTAPYMHDGSLSTLSQVLDHYAAGGQTLHAGPHAGVGSANPYKSSFVRGFQLSGAERSDLLAFLESLTDETFVLNRRFASPFSEPAGFR